MAILSVDPAYKRYTDIGVVVLEQTDGLIRCEQMELQLSGVPATEDLAGCLNNSCLRNNIRLLLLDGPQGWKASDNGLVHSRWCENEPGTPAKTGEPFMVKPAPYSNFVTFSIATYDSLVSRGWERLPKVGSLLGESHRLLVETFPWSAWKKLGIARLPSKRKSRVEDIADRLQALRRLFPIELGFSPSHDELQAIVAGLSGLAIERGDWETCVVSGREPIFENGHWREGFIVNRVATRR